MKIVSTSRAELLAAALVLLLAGVADAGAEPPAAAVPADREVPQRLKIPGLAEHEEPNAVLLVSRIYPLGWSPQGLFAYVYEPADEACGCYFFELIVQDLKSDRIVWHHKYSSDPLEADDRQRFEDLPAIWKAREKEFSAKLRELGIVRRHQPDLAAFAGNPQGLATSIETRKAGDDVNVFVHLSRYAIELAGPKGRKTIFRSDAAGVTTAEIGPFEVACSGFLSSPYEKRIAVLIEETWRGWEGPPAVLQLRFAGADLDRGFR